MATVNHSILLTRSFPIQYSANVYTATSWASLYSTTVKDDMANHDILNVYANSPNDAFTLTTTDISAYGRIRFFNSSSNNIHIVINGVTNNLAEGEVRTFISIPGGYTSFNAV
jgi:hypothetical protein